MPESFYNVKSLLAGENVFCKIDNIKAVFRRPFLIYEKPRN